MWDIVGLKITVFSYHKNLLYSETLSESQCVIHFRLIIAYFGTTIQNIYEVNHTYQTRRDKYYKVSMLCKQGIYNWPGIKSRICVNSRVPTTVRHGSSFHRIFPKTQSHPRRLSIVWRRNYWLKSQTSVLWPTLKLLTRVPVVCPSTDAEAIDSHHSHVSLDRHNY